MNFVKTNLYLIISGVVVLLAIGAYFWPLQSLREDLQAKMSQRIGRVPEVRKLSTSTIEVFPGGKKIPGPVQQNVIDARDEAQKHMKSQASAIAGLAAAQNQANRAVVRGNRTVPLLGGKEQLGYLPESAPGTDAHDFKDWYLKVTANWPVLLASNEQVVAAAPTQAEVTAAADAYDRAKIASTPAYGGMAPPNFLGAGGLDSKKKMDFMRDFVSKRASVIRMYVTLESFDREAWSVGTGAPNAAQIYESLVRCWLQQDVVNAIDAVNRDAQGNPTKDVGQSALKRLEWIKVGGETGGSLFQMGAAVGPRGRGMPTGAMQAEASRTMTGRVSTSDYDVVVMTVAVVIDPAKLNVFIDKLYRQNNAYTVLNVKQTTVDPFQAASEGYLYGETQCVRAEVQIEALLFRKWTAPMMPDVIRNQLGVMLPK